MKIKSDFYRLSWLWQNPMGGAVYDFEDDESQTALLDLYEIKKQKRAYSNFRLSFISWDSPLND